MIKYIRFFNRSYEYLCVAMHKLRERYRIVGLHRSIKCGLFNGYFTVQLIGEKGGNLRKPSLFNKNIVNL